MAVVAKEREDSQGAQYGGWMDMEVSYEIGVSLEGIPRSSI